MGCSASPSDWRYLEGSKVLRKTIFGEKLVFFTCSRRSIFDTYDLLWPVDRPPWTLKDLTKHLDTLQHACRAYWKGLGLFGGARGPYSVRTCGHEQNLILLLFLPGHPMSTWHHHVPPQVTMNTKTLGKVSRHVASCMQSASEGYGVVWWCVGAMWCPYMDMSKTWFCSCSYTDTQ